MSRILPQPKNQQIAPARAGASSMVPISPDDSGRRVGRAMFYMGIFAGLPTLAFGLTYELTPLAPMLILPRAIISACLLTSRRHPAYEDTPPVLAAIVQSTLVWLGIGCCFPAIFAYDQAVTVIWQLSSGGVIALFGPGTALELADLPRQIYIPRQAAPQLDPFHQKQVTRGQLVRSSDELNTERQHGLDSPSGDDSQPADDSLQAWDSLVIPWGSVFSEHEQFSNNNRIMFGGPGAGKSLQMRQLMYALLPWPKSRALSSVAKTTELGHQLRVFDEARATPNAEQRSRIFQSIVYDGKSEHFNRLVAHGFTPGKDLFLLNPLNTECMVWDIAADVTTKIEAAEFADLVVSDITPPAHMSGASKHFYDVANTVTLQVVQVLQKTKNWRLRDLIHCFSSPEMIRHVLKQHPEGGHSTAHIRDTEEGRSAFSTLQRYMQKLSVVAAAWDAVERKHGRARMISLTRWVEKAEGTVLLLPDGDEYSKTIRPFLRFIFRRLTQLMLSPKYLGTQQRRTIFLDELPTAGKLPSLPRLLAKGREYGITVTIGIQDIGQMFEEYGRNMANTIFNCCPYRAYFKCIGETAVWASQQIGKQIVRYPQENYGFNDSYNQGRAESLNKDNITVWLKSEQYGSGRNHGFTMVEQERDAVMPAEFMKIPDIETSQIVAGYFSDPSGDVYFDATPLEDVLGRIVWEPKDKQLKEDLTIGPKEQTLRPWNDSDYPRIGLAKPADEEESGKKATKKKRKPRRRKPTRKSAIDIEF